MGGVPEESEALSAEEIVLRQRQERERIDRATYETLDDLLAEFD